MHIKELLKPKIRKSTAPHELADSVNYIKRYIGFTKKYSGGYWLKRIKLSGKTNYQIRQLVDEAMTFDRRYNRGGFLTNSLK